MIFAFDDTVWNTIINGAYGLIGLYLTYKLNSIQKRQIQNSKKIDVAAENAAVAADKAQATAVKIDSAAEAISQVKELAVANVDKIEQVQRATNGMKDELVEAVGKAARAEGIVQGRGEARTRSTDQDPNKLPIKEH